MIGTWNAEALVRRAGRDDVRAPFTFQLGAPPGPLGRGGQPVTGPPGAVGAPGTPVAPAEARFLKNPVPPTEESLARGQQIYVQNCLVCHGPQGRGDGPAARALRPPPADLTQHVTAHTEGELWWWITNGVAGTQMPAWKNALSDRERWDVLNYVVAAFAPATR
jgi:mono/diheme cytochrome c family protein